MHTLTKKMRQRVYGLKVDAGTKAGLLSIFEHTGHLKTVKELRHLSERERDLFSRGFTDYLEKHDHPVRAVHAPLHYGRVIFVLAIIYFASILPWIVSLINLSIVFDRDVMFPRVGIWLMSTVAINTVLLIYGIRLEKMSYSHHFKTIHRVMAFAIITTLIIGIVSNMFAPYMAGDSSAVIQTFLRPK